MTQIHKLSLTHAQAHIWECTGMHAYIHMQAQRHVITHTLAQHWLMVTGAMHIHTDRHQPHIQMWCLPAIPETPMDTRLDISHPMAPADIGPRTCALPQTCPPLSPWKDPEDKCVVFGSMYVFLSVSLPGRCRPLESGPALGFLCWRHPQGRWEELRHGTGLGNRLSPPGDSGWSWGSKIFLIRSSGPAASLSSSQGRGGEIGW